MIRFFMALGLVLAHVGPIFAQPSASPLTPPPDPNSSTRDWQREPREGWERRETPAQTRQRLEREGEYRSPLEPKSNPTFKPGFEPARPQQQPSGIPNSGSWPRSR